MAMSFLRDILVAANPGLDVPDAAQPSFLIGYSLILFSLFTVTYNHPSLRYLRLALVPPTLYALADFSFFGKYEPEKLRRIVIMGMAMLSIYGSFKIVEIGVIGFWNKPEDWPKWVTLEGKEHVDPDTGKPVERKVIPFTPTVWGRLCWAYDLMSVRGSSWYRGRVWDFAPAAIRNQDPKPVPQVKFFFSNLLKLTETYLILDVLETIVATRPWSTTNPYPVTSLPSIPQQLLYAFCICAHIGAGIIIPHAFGAFLTSLIGVSSTAWPPMFDHPFAAGSLAEFWGIKWHPVFRRIFSETSRGMMAILPTTFFRVSPRGVKFIRAFLIFLCSWTLHLFLLWAPPADPAFPPPKLLNLQSAKFFLAQPLGIAIELLIIAPLTKNLPRPVTTTLRRMFAWAWLLASGRYWADVWYSHGFLEHQERYILVSPFRGLLWGQWYT